MDQQKATPEQLLRQIQSQQEKQGKGKLKIFFGYAAGVGKTYTMLRAAHQALDQGIDVVAGYIEPHARPETAALMAGIPSLPPLLAQHKKMTLKEFDLDAALARSPQLILVDELAHTNADSCRHHKRYQDIEELLYNGIDVYTTVNVQHIESLNDIVASITGVMVRERIPDKVFDLADQVELVDIEPQELITRLSEGKIYNHHQAQKALGHFFDVQNLVALREIALRRTADRVNLVSERAKIDSGGEYYTDENILVCLSSSPSNAKIIRTAARMANAFRGVFTAIFVETCDFGAMGEQDRARLRANIQLAQRLGAKIETVMGDDIAFQIAQYAKIAGVSKIVLGRSNAKRKFLFARPSFSQQLTDLAPNLDVYIIPDSAAPSYKAPRAKSKRQIISAMDLLIASGVLAVASLVGVCFTGMSFSEANIITVYILGVLITAMITTTTATSIFSSVFSVLIFNFLFTDPKYTLNVYDGGYPVTFLIMLVAGLFTSSVARKLKRQAAQSAQSAYRTKVLLDTSQLLGQQTDALCIHQVTATQLVRLLQKDVVFYPVSHDVLCDPSVFLADETKQNQPIYTSENEKAVAQWVYKNNTHAGAGTGTLGNAACQYLAVRTPSRVYGVVGLSMTSGHGLQAFENNMVLAILSECALALEKERLGRKRQEAKELADNELLRSNLLRSISHDLRTPLTCISGNAGVLLDSDLSQEQKRQLYTDIFDDSMWLINLVENLLSVTRIQNGSMHIDMQAELVEELIAEALKHISRKSVDHKLIVHQPEGFVLAKVDPHLMMQVIINIVDNAIKYTPKGSVIEISTACESGKVHVQIADDGPGISNRDKEKIFDMFYTANSQSADSRRGIGLGLSLCKCIITAHGGDLWVTDNQPSGTVFHFTLQCVEVDIDE